MDYGIYSDYIFSVFAHMYKFYLNWILKVRESHLII